MRRYKVLLPQRYTDNIGLRGLWVQIFFLNIALPIQIVNYTFKEGETNNNNNSAMSV